ncbi:phospho-sugar mutase [Phytohabitans rumicis]|uniref:Phosphomannomutase n=1 Tax=Phytohabitans rumicis TaxID=1076125 RepID=A0A6V8LF58_9ACTN|nr:phospho-sugar mutase [Phytohabitans rumicis]GFJ91275.1 phosphomannomutase [Phytohabitans rumicis]
MNELRERAQAWIDDDPDPASRAELRAVLDRLPETAADLADRFAGPLTFGTAGLRGPLRAGPNGMNLAVVTQAAAGLVTWLAARDTPGPLVIGYDARRGSKAFAEQTARVATGAGRAALVLPRPLPTPVLAYAVRVLGAVAGVMVTASHNPPQDNGYKVYLGDGAQIVPPVDAEIEAAIRTVGPLSGVPLGEPGEVLDEDLVTSYVDSAAAVLDPDGPRELGVAYTPLHGVGAAVLTAAFRRAGFATPAVVPEQAEPDPAFPTVAFPNPEEPGAIDRVIALADVNGADIAIANDPDADRCAVAIPDPVRGWRMLRGDEVGVLIADHLMRQGRRGRYATTIVSSSLLKAMCAARGMPYAQTLTGFKWIVRAGDGLVFGYEEALGYCVAPDHVRDKDGITAALTVAELAAGLRAELRTLADRLDDIAAEFGVYVTDQLSVRVDAAHEIGDIMTRLRGKTPDALLDEPVTSVEDLLPDADVVILRTDTARVVVRPSGTEPKLKAYLEVVEPVVDDDIPAARERAAASVRALRTETAAALGIW